MTPVRETFWNIPHWAELAQYVLGILTVLVFGAGVYLRARRWRLGRPEQLRGRLRDRLGAVAVYALAQVRILTDHFSGSMHLALFWGMVVLFLGTVLATVDWDITRLLLDFQFLRGSVYLGYELVLDLFGAAVAVGLAMGIWRRYVRRPRRLASETVPTFAGDDTYLLGMLLLIVVSGYVVEGLRISVDAPVWRAWSPIGSALADAFRPVPIATLRALHVGLWAGHALLAFVFIASIPFTKAFHLVSSPANVFFRDFSPSGVLKAGPGAGAGALTDFSWKQLLELDACTWCGRCQDVCPAYASGHPLSPKHLIMKLDSQLLRQGVRRGGNPHGGTSLHGPVVSAPELWACTTCGACAEVCPVFIRQPQIIVDLRRRLVSEGTMDGMLQSALQNLTRYGNSFGQSERARGRWTQTLGFKVKDARREPVEFVWLTGDYAAYDPRVQEMTRAVARIFRAAEVDFGLLYEGERNAGNDARRVGEEGLFEMLRDKNREALAAARFRCIVTTDPHTYHALRHEYDSAIHGSAGGTQVLHYSELLDSLIQFGRLPLRRRLHLTATYHDPCYLGRYGGVYDPPRRVLRALGVRIVEMPRSRGGSFCCGAGGGRIWMEDTPGEAERPAEQRVREAAALPGVSVLVVTCPKDLVMFRDAVKTTGLDGRLAVRDLAELVDEAVTAEEASHAA